MVVRTFTMAPSAENDTAFSGGKVNISAAQKNLPKWSESEQEPVWKEAAESIEAGCCGRADGDLVPPWMDWVDSGVEFFGCEGEGGSGKSVIGRALTLQHNTERIEKSDLDFARLHEEFFESLLREQVNRSGIETLEPPELTPINSQDESISSGVSSSSSCTLDSVATQSLSSTKTQKRRRPLRLLKLSPRRKHHTRVAPIEAYNQKYNPALVHSTISLEDLAKKKLPDSPSFLHPKCVLQKDKGKGNPLGSSISAEGRESCLEKLREKMSIVIQVSGEERKAPTGMKRRIAKVSANAPCYIETRSMIELRLGFLSMQYGLLLHWDYHRTGKIIFIALRKMCHDSFYTKIPDIIHQETKTTTITRKQLDAPPLVVRSMVGNHAIYQRTLGTEVVLIDPPYLVPQPEAFAPSVLTVDINNVVGLSKKNRWTISITFNGHTEVSHLHFNHEKRIFEPRRACMTWEMTPVSSFDLAGLEIRLFVQHRRKNSHSRLAATMTMPLGGLVAQPSTTQATSWQLTMPFTHDPKANLTLSINHQSDYAHWLYKELDARRSEEVSGFVWRAPFRFMKNGPRSVEDDEPKEDMWDWLCGVCFKEYYLPVDLA
jgi:hypothetical protein